MHPADCDHYLSSCVSCHPASQAFVPGILLESCRSTSSTPPSTLCASRCVRPGSSCRRRCSRRRRMLVWRWAAACLCGSSSSGGSTIRWAQLLLQLAGRWRRMQGAVAAWQAGQAAGTCPFSTLHQSFNMDGVVCRPPTVSGTGPLNRLHAVGALGGTAQPCPLRAGCTRVVAVTLCGRCYAVPTFLPASSTPCCCARSAR